MNLRGTYRKSEINKALSGRPTLQNQISALRSQVNRQKPETQFYRFAGNHNSTGTTIEQQNHLVTQTLISSTNFRDKVTGDEWANSLLKMKFNMEKDCKYARIIVYVPKKAGDRFTPSTFKSVTQPDPSSFWILADFFVNHKDNNTNEAITRQFSLRKLKTIYDSNAAAITKGEVLFTVIAQPTTALTLQYSYGIELVYNNL